MSAIHDVISSTRPDLEVSLEGSASGLPRGSIQFCHVGCDRNAGLIGRGEKVDGLNTSSEPLESLGNGGIKVDCLDDFSAGSISA